MCTRFIGRVKSGKSIEIKVYTGFWYEAILHTAMQKDAKLSDVQIYIGLTDEKRIGVSAALFFKVENKNITYEAEKIFIHPLLGTAKVGIHPQTEIESYSNPGIHNDPRHGFD